MLHVCVFDVCVQSYLLLHLGLDFVVLCPEVCERAGLLQPLHKLQPMSRGAGKVKIYEVVRTPNKNEREHVENK